MSRKTRMVMYNNEADEFSISSSKSQTLARRGYQRSAMEAGHAHHSNKNAHSPL